MRNFALLTSVCTVFFVACIAHAQQIDLALGASSPYSSANRTASQAYIAPPEKSGLYPTFSGDVLFRKKNRLGVNLEIAVRAKQGLYNGYQAFRPIFTDTNAMYSIQTSKKTRADFLAGVGVESVLFYNQFGTCNSAYPSCVVNLNANHFMAHIGGGVRYYFWRSFFVRPEIHLYVIPNNSQFNSDYVGRAAVTIGYTWPPVGRTKPPAKKAAP